MATTLTIAIGLIMFSCGFPKENNSSESQKEVQKEALFKVNSQYGYCFVNREGHPVIPPQFDYACDFSEGLALVKIGENCGFINDTGAMIIQPRFQSTSVLSQGFSEGLAAVAIANKWGYIDKTGQFVINPQFYMAYKFSEGLAMVTPDEGGFGFVDRTGKHGH